MAEQVWVNEAVQTPTPEPSPSGEFTLGQGVVGETQLSDKEAGIFGFIMLIAILIFFVGGVIYDKKRKP